MALKGINLTKQKDVVLPKQKTKSVVITQESVVDEKSIKTPLDFDSLHDIRSFGQTYKQVISFIDNIKKYQNEYLDNMMKSKNELLDFIPEKQLALYDVYIQDRKLCNWNDFAIDIIQKQIPDRLAGKRKEYRKQGIELVGLIDNRTKIYLIDTINKKIYLCLWYRHHYRETVHGWMYGYHFTLEYGYDRGYTFEILPDEDIFRVRVNLISNRIIDYDTYARYVSEGNGYHFDFLNSRGNSGQEVYDFCMRTNNFKEFNEKESQFSSWRGISYCNTFKY